MYYDLITYCSDTTALLTEVEQLAPDYLIKDENGNSIGFAINKTPTIRNSTETLAVVRVNDDELAVIKSLTSLNVLAEVPAGGNLLASMLASNKAIYDKVYLRTPIDIFDDQGNVVGQQTPPELIGAFA